jgi:predicted RecB family nuclease
VQCRPFNYSGNTILSLKDYKDRQKTEIRRVKGLTSTGVGYCLVDPRVAGSLYCSDSTTLLNGCGKGTAEKLQAHAINTVGDLKAQTDEDLQKILDILIARLQTLYHAAQACLDTEAPERIDFC